MNSNRPKSMIWPPGLGLAVGFVLWILFLAITVFNAWSLNILLCVLGFLTISVIIIEYFNYRKRIPVIEAGYYLPSHPLAKTSVVFWLLSFILIIIGLGAITGITRNGHIQDSWTLFYVNGIAWDINILSIIALFFSALSLANSFRSGKHGKSLAIIILVLCIITIWLNMTFLVPVVLGTNEGLINNYFGS